MLKYFKDNYADGREPIDTGLLVNILKESLKMNGVDVTDDTCFSTISLLFAGINYYFYLHPEQYVDFGKFVAYRGVDLKNLLTIETKEPENASTIYSYYRNGGIQMDMLKRTINNYASVLLAQSTQDEEAVANDITKLRGLTSQSKIDDYNNKENENGF